MFITWNSILCLKVEILFMKKKKCHIPPNLNDCINKICYMFIHLNFWRAQFIIHKNSSSELCKIYSCQPLLKFKKMMGNIRFPVRLRRHGKNDKQKMPFQQYFWQYFVPWIDGIIFKMLISAKILNRSFQTRIL